MENTIISTNINDYIVRSKQKKWEPLIEKGIHYEGISVMSLHYDEQKQRSTTILLKFEPGATYPYHNHPAGEQVLVLEGDATFNTTILKAGDYLYTPPGFKHSVTSATGATLFFVVPEEVEILK